MHNVLLALALALLQPAPQMRDPHPRLHVTVWVTPSRYAGPCPGRIAFRGQVTPGVVLGGTPIAGDLSYTWLRSDGATGPILHTRLGHGDVALVEETWTLGGVALRKTSQWEQLKAWWTAEGPESAVTSDRAAFDLVCR